MISRDEADEMWRAYREEKQRRLSGLDRRLNLIQRVVRWVTNQEESET